MPFLAILAALAVLVVAFLLLRRLSRSWTMVRDDVVHVRHEEWEQWVGVCPHTYDDQYADRVDTVLIFTDGTEMRLPGAVGESGLGTRRLMKNRLGSYRLE